MSRQRLLGVLVGVATAGSLCAPVRAADVPFGPQQRITRGPTDRAFSVFAADVDGDGDTDVLSASLGDNKIAWYENTDGAGTFGPQRVISTDAYAAQSVFAADVDGDGDIDVLSASFDEIAWYENTDGAGTFGPQQVISTATEFASSVFAADVDGDGDIDVLSASAGDDKIAWYENLLGCLRPDFDCDGDVDLGDYLSFVSCFTGPAGAPGDGCHRADLDRDGDVDLADLLMLQAAFTGAK